MVAPKIIVNVPGSEAHKARILREEHFWTGPRLILLGCVTLTAALVLLQFMASTTSETTWSDWLIP